jgi:hypothetical protein
MFIRYSPVDELARGIVAQLPEPLFKSPSTTFVDPDMASASYLLAVKERLEFYEHNKYNIQDRLFGFCSSRIKQNNIKKRFGWAPIFIKERFLDYMKWFDTVIGNPPFSLAGNKKGKKGRAKNLYPDFYEKAISIAKNVAMIVPNTEKQLISFNSFIRENTNKIINIPDGTFPINISTWVLIKDNSETDVNHIDWVDLQKMPKQKVLWAKGKINVTTDHELLVDQTDGIYRIIHKINRTGLISSNTSRYIDHRKLFPQQGYAVIMPQQIQSTGWSATKILKCTGKEAATNGVNIAFVDSYEEATYLVEYMKTEKFVKQALRNCGGMNNMTLGAMQRIDMSDYMFESNAHHQLI